MVLCVMRRVLSFLCLSLPCAAIAAGVWITGRSLVAPEIANSAVIAPHALDERSQAAVSQLPSAIGGNDTVIQPGDTLKIAIYERLVAEDDKWMARSHSRRPPMSFQQRMELSGDYEVQENGRVFLPLLGPFDVAGKTAGQFEAETKQVFDRLMGRFAFMSIIVEGRPVYVVGPVRKPGTYKYMSGMTVLHLVALAGGFDRTSVDLGHMVQAAHEIEAKERSQEAVKRLYARLSVLEAERDGLAPQAPPHLAALAGGETASALVASEQSIRTLAVASQRLAHENLLFALKAANDELRAKTERREKIETNVKLRLERVEGIRALSEKIGRAVRLQAEAELSDVKERLDEASVAVREAETKVQQLDKQQLTAGLDLKMQREREIMSLKAEIAEASSRGAASAGALTAMSTILKQNQDDTSARLKFEIVRGKRNEPLVSEAVGTTLLNPGDLIRIRSGN